MKSIKAWGVGQLATSPLLTLTIIVINSDTQSSLFTGSRERETDKLVYWRGPLSQGAVVHHLGKGGWGGGAVVGGMRRRGGERGTGGTTIKNTV